ncbi:hypothetical protein WDM22_21485 [Bradyrhizobium septentrionale]|uniref:hypothetical protein n=1 Tax=Bradyrhizobium septentrionale TaxID=1404411 RepID=UPI0030D30B69
MAGIVARFNALTPDEVIRACPEINAALDAAKGARRSPLEAEIRQLGFRPSEGTGMALGNGDVYQYAQNYLSRRRRHCIDVSGHFLKDTQEHGIYTFFAADDDQRELLQVRSHVQREELSRYAARAVSYLLSAGKDIQSQSAEGLDRRNEQ